MHAEKRAPLQLLAQKCTDTGTEKHEECQDKQMQGCLPSNYLNSGSHGNNSRVLCILPVMHSGLEEVWANEKLSGDGHQRGHWKENKSKRRQQKEEQGAGKRDMRSVRGKNMVYKHQQKRNRRRWRRESKASRGKDKELCQVFSVLSFKP